MSCYHPNIAFPTGKLTDSGKHQFSVRYSCCSSDVQKELELNPGSIAIPCGKCIGCRLDYSRAWADRMMLELENSKKAVFVTLTYDNEHCHWTQFDLDGNPMYATLDKRDCQLFMKRLRKEFFDIKIRFFLGGEYGPSTLRPHYHLILFGLGLCDFPDLLPHGRNELGQQYYISAKLSQIWSSGFTLLSDVSWKTCAYVARYVTKKLSGPLSIDYAVRNVIPEFSLMSRKPGIGRLYLDEHPECLDMQSINLSTPEGGLKIAIPRYFLKQLDNENSCLYNPEKYDKIKSDRRRYASDSMFLQLQKTNLSLVDYLETKEQKKLESVKALRRSKVD